ncbi:hypothetical protein, partial [Leptospira santarosai]|uniref:hypothetical protein n=1 Tax=Leptospira santarosai TaxID=28183 RepID=UPI0005198672
TVGKPSGYSGFLHNPDAKRMSFILPENQGKAQEQIGRFVQDFQRLNAGRFAISNAVTGTSSTPTPPAPKPPVGGTDPKPPTTTITNSGKSDPEKKDDSNSTIIAVVAIVIGIYLYSNMKKGKRR